MGDIHIIIIHTYTVSNAHIHTYMYISQSILMKVDDVINLAIQLY